jgi:hypothetical protein
MMSQILRRIQLPLLGTILLGLFAAAYLAAYKRFTKKSASSKTVAKHKVKKPANEVLKYWTADKMQHATGVALPKVDAPNQEQQHPHKSGPQQD